MEETQVAVADPVRIVVADDLRRSRLTVFFRLLLAIPHFVWLFAWTLAALLAAVANWIATLVTGVPPLPLHRFLSAYIRYAAHVTAYTALTANPFPGFVGAAGTYPVDVELPPPEPQRRATVFFRPFLAIPALILGGGLYSPFTNNPDLVSVSAVFGWFASLVRGRMPEGMRDAQAFALRYVAHTWAYVFLLTGRYPNADPSLERAAPVREHPVALELDDDLRRSRLTVFFRLLLALPHFVWLTLWSLVALLAAIAAWFAALVTGIVPQPLHRFLSAFVRYSVHVTAYVALVANPFPGFTGSRGYVVEISLPGPERQNRWTVGFRAMLAFPVLFLQATIGWVMYLAAFLGWFASLVLGRMPLGLRNAGAWGVRYMGQAYAYFYLVTARYPFSGPPG